MLNSFWNWFVIIITIVSILGCWWLLHWTKGVSDRSGDDVGSTGHVWDEDLKELNTPLPRWWLHLFNITIIFALVYLVFFPGLGNFAGMLGWTQESQYEEEVAAAAVAQESVFARFRDMDLEPGNRRHNADGRIGAVAAQRLAPCRRSRQEVRLLETVRCQSAGKYLGHGAGRPVHSLWQRHVRAGTDDTARRSSPRLRLRGNDAAARRSRHCRTQRTTHQLHGPASQRSQILKSSF